MRIVVIGGQGRLGTEVVRRLEARGASVTSASRRTGVDLATGAGLEATLETMGGERYFPFVSPGSAPGECAVTMEGFFTPQTLAVFRGG